MASSSRFRSIGPATTAALVLAGGFSLAARADDATGIPGDFSANVGIVSEYAFRGVQQSDENLAIQGGFDWSHDSGVYAGVWGSNVDFNDGDEANVEIDLYAGYAGGFSGFTYDVGILYYAYPGADNDLNYDYVEGKFTLGYDFGVLALSGSIFYSPEFFADSDDAVYYSGDVEVPLPYDFTLTGHIGRQTIDDNAAFALPDYTDWGIGIGYTLAGFDLSATYIDTDLSDSECADGCDGRVIFGISRSF